MNRSKGTIRSKLFQMVNSKNSRVYLMENKIYELPQGKKSHPISSLDQNIRFSISKFEKKNKIQYFQLTIKNIGQQIQVKVQTQDDLELWIKYLGKYGYGYGLQAIALEFQKIGKGNFATVYKFVSSYNTVKAMKMFQKRRLQNSKSKLSFLNEIKIMRSLYSPYLASLDCIFQTDKTFYLQMQYFEQTLRAYLKKPRPKSIQKLMMKNLLQGLKQLKQKNIIHRDIKPDNIMVRESKSSEPQFVIIDFGLGARISQQDLIHKKCGTPGFIAPEIANMTQKTKITAQCDIFSLGVTFFYILTRKKPFLGADNKQILYKNKKMIIQQHLFYYMSDLESDLIRRMMEKDPQKRITVEQAMNHHYFQPQIDDQDLIEEQCCDLDSKLKQIKIMDTSFMSEGIVLLYSLLRFTHNKSRTKQQFTKCFVDTEFHELESHQQSIDMQLSGIIKNKRIKSSKIQQRAKIRNDDSSQII